MKLNIGMKIGLGFSVIIVMIIVILGYSYISTSSIQNDMLNATKTNKRLILISEIRNDYFQAVAAIRGFIAYGDEKFSRQVEESLNRAIENEKQILALARPEKKQDVQNLIDNTTKYKEGLMKDLIPVVKEQYREEAGGNFEKAQALKKQSGTIARSLIPFTEQVSSVLDTLTKENEQISTKFMEDVLESVINVNRVSLIVGILIFLFVIIISFIITRMVRNPINSMLVVAKQYGNGDFRERVANESDDELGELSAVLNTMRESLISIVKGMIHSSENIAASSEQLTASSEQSAQAANQVAGAITEVAAGTARQLKAVEATTSTVEQMSESIQQIAANAGSVAITTEKTSNAAKEGGKAVEDATSQMANIVQSVTHSAQVVRDLGERSKEIGQIVDTISGIAGQTNLLALNAAIEAARAGEQGRGFAVVAEEVRKLAEQSQEAAKKIAELITEIQNDTEKAVVAMADGTQEVKRGTEVVNLAGQVFGEITSLVEQVSGQVREISAAIQQMAGGSQQIVCSVKEIDQISKDTAGQAQTVSAATEEQSASMEEIASSSQALSGMAEELRTIISKFKI